MGSLVYLLIVYVFIWHKLIYIFFLCVTALLWKHVTNTRCFIPIPIMAWIISNVQFYPEGFD